MVNRQASHDYLLINHPNLDLYPPQQTVEDGLLALSNGDLDVMVTHIPAVSYTVARLGLSNLRITSITPPYQYDLRLAVSPAQPAAPPHSEQGAGQSADVRNRSHL